MSCRILARTAVNLTFWLVLTAPVHAAIIDFNAATPTEFATVPYDEDGFRISVLTGHYDIWDPGICGIGPVICTSNFLGVDGHSLGGGDSRLRITAISGSNFDLFSLFVLDAESTTGATCDATCTVTSSNGGFAPFVSQGPMIFTGAEWTNLAWVEFFAATSAGNYATAQIDDIVVAPIPVPVSIWLLGSALGVLGVLRRKFVDSSKVS